MKCLRLFGRKRGKWRALSGSLLLLMAGALVLPFVAQAAQVKISVFNFVTLNMEASRYGTDVTNMLGDSLKADPTYDVLDRKDLEAFLNLNDYQQDDRLDNAVNIGTRLGLNAIVVGNVEKKGAVIIVNCKVILVEQKKIILNTRIGGRGDAGLAAEVHKLKGLINDAIAKHVLKLSDDQLKAPVNVQKRPGNKQIFLSWEDTPEANADGYDIFRSSSESGPFAKVGQVSQREYLDKDLEKNTVYFYKIKSFKNTGQQSGFTEVIKAETSITPNPPVILKAEARVKSIQLTFSPSPVPSEDPLKLTGVKLYRAKTEQGPFREVADLTSADLAVPSETTLDKVSKLTYVDKNLNDGEEAFYRLTVYNEKKMESGFSSVVKGAAMSVIKGLTAQGGLFRQVDLTWHAVDASLIGGYGIYRHTEEAGEFKRIKKVDAERGEVTMKYSDRDGLADNTRYYYRVTVYDDMDQQSAPSTAVSAQTKAKPVKPAGLKSDKTQVKTVPIEWQANPEKDIDGYHVYRRLGVNGEFGSIAKVRGGETRYLDKDVKDGLTYAYKIQAEDKDGLLSDFSEEIQVSMKPRPKSPEGLAGKYKDGIVELSWKPGTESDIAFYKIYEKSFWGTEVVPGLGKISDTTVAFKLKLDKGKQKVYRILAVDKDGLESDYSPEIVVAGN